ncbi:MAG TPA: clostripain-related cysteine peptidase [Anaerolineae bacterium]|nr:clostripain-related cysteine peptidase [Anaerolineae bacterium]
MLKLAGHKSQKRRWLWLLLSLVLLMGLVACDDEPLDERGDEFLDEDTAVTEPLDDDDDEGDDDEDFGDEEEAETNDGGETSSGGGVAAPSGGNPEGQTWLIMLYQDADDEILELDIFVDTNEAELVGSQDRVHIVAQLDRYDGAFDGDGDWQGTKRFYLEQDDDPLSLGSQEVMDLGEVNMASGAALIDFVTWAVAEYPADKHVLILSDHGAGWPGGWSDPDPGAAGPDDHDIPLAQYGDMLFLMEMDEALGIIRERTGIEKFELVGFDACLMAHIEVFAAMAPHARYAVASQESEPAVGWAYGAFLGDLVNNPDMDGAALSTAIVESYLDKDIRLAGEEALLSELQREMTLSAMDLAQMPAVLAALDDLSVVMSQAEAQPIAKARTFARSFSGYFDDRRPYNYIDLGHFAAVAKEETGDGAVAEAADALNAALAASMVAERHGADQAGSTGLSIYFPNSELFQGAASGYESYTTVSSRFAQDSLWDEFLVAHYTGEVLTAPEPDAGGEVAPPPAEEAVVAPGKGEITVSDLTVSAEVASVEEPVTVEATISGDVAYIYFFVGSYLEGDEELLITTMDFVEAEASKEIGGLLYPDWGDGESFTLEYEWEAVDFLLAEEEGEQAAFTLFYPEEYGQTFEETTYSVEGIYTFAASGNERYATMYFLGDEFTSVYGYTNPESSTGSPREITVRAGDTFTVLDWIIPLDDEEEDYEEEGETLVLGQDVIIAASAPAPNGDYLIGFIVEDFDGNIYETFETVTVDNGEPDFVDEEDEVGDGGIGGSQAYVPVSDDDGLFTVDVPADWVTSTDGGVVWAAPDLDSWWGSYVLEGTEAEAAGLYIGVSDVGYEQSNEDLVAALTSQLGPSNCELLDEQVSYDTVSYENVANFYGCGESGLYLILFGYDPANPTYQIWIEGYGMSDDEYEALDWAVGSLTAE